MMYEVEVRVSDQLVNSSEVELLVCRALTALGFSVESIEVRRAPQYEK